MLTHERLLEVLEYNPETGRFLWKVKSGSRSAGSVAGTPDKDGYCQIRIDKHPYKAHRLAWFYMNKRWPADQIDHANMDKYDNRISNLREATPQLNQFNKVAYKNNRSGVKGIYMDTKLNKWRAQIKIDGRKIYLGLYDCIAAASIAYQIAADKYHGEFARSA